MKEQEKIDKKSELIADLNATVTVMEEIWKYHPDNPDKVDIRHEYKILETIKANVTEELDNLES